MMRFIGIWLLAAAAVFNVFEQSAANDIGASEILDAATRIVDSNNAVSNLKNLNPLVSVDVNALNSVTQTASGAVSSGTGLASTAGSSTRSTVDRLQNVNPQRNAAVYALNNVNQEATAAIDGVAGTAVENDIGVNQFPTTDTRISGNNNILTSLLTHNPARNVEVGVLNAINQETTSGSGVAEAVGLSDTEYPNYIDSSQESKSNFTNANASPAVNVGVDLLNTVTQNGTSATSGLGGNGNSIGSVQTLNSGTSILGNNNQGTRNNIGGNQVRPSNAPAGGTSSGLLEGVFGNLSGIKNSIGGNQAASTGTSIVENGNHLGSLLNLNPEVNVDVNALNAVNQRTPVGTGGTGADALSSAGNKIDTSQTQNAGTQIVGQDNTVSSLANNSPQVNAGVNQLNTATQTQVDNMPPQIGINIDLFNALTDAGVRELECEIVPQEPISGTNIADNNNQVVSGIDISPQINLELNTLNGVRQQLRCRPMVPTATPPPRPLPPMPQPPLPRTILLPTHPILPGTLPPANSPYPSTYPPSQFPPYVYYPENVFYNYHTLPSLSNAEIPWE